MSDEKPTVDDITMDALIYAESNGDPQAVGPMTKYGQAKGLCQLLDTTGHEWHKRLQLDGPYEPYNPIQNRTIGKAYLEAMLKQFGTLELALAAYNWGPGNLRKLRMKMGLATFSDLEPFLPRETQNYVKKIMRKRAELSAVV